MSLKRARMSDPDVMDYGSRYTRGQKAGYWAARKFNRLHPWPTHGAARIQRGSELSLAAFGPTYKQATDEQKANRKYTGFTGKGLYLGSSFGGQGNYFRRMMRRQMHRTMAGQTPLGQLGKRLGRTAIRRAEGALMASGNGSYDISANNLVAGGGLSVPTFATHSDETGSLVIKHEEYVKDIYGVPWSGGSVVEPFVNDAIGLNPGLSSSFPWLSQIAANYEEYEFLQLMFCFKTRVGDNLTTTDGQVGTLLMFTDYNATDQKRRTKQDMLQAYGTSTAKISDSDILHGIECDPSKIKGDAHKFVRTGGITQDLHDFDWGLFQVAVDNTPEVLSNKVVGELYVSYTVRLSKPRLFSQLGLSINQDQFLVNHIASGNPNPTISTAILGTGVSNSIGCVLATTASGNNASNHLITLPASFSGNVEVLVVVDRITAAGTGSVKDMYIDSLTGNVAFSRDLPAGESRLEDGSSDDVDPNFGSMIALANATTTSSVMLCHLRTSMAAFGVDNSFNIVVKSDNNADESHYKIWICVRRYNSLDKVTADQFKDPAGRIIDITSPAIAN